MMHQNDIVFTTYETLRSDWQGQRLLYSKPWLRVILDEGQSVHPLLRYRWHLRLI